MPTKLKVLIAEDSAADAELALHELHRAGYDPEWARVETESDFLTQLDRSWDIILADYNLPEFSGPRALELLRERNPDLPFIIVSGTIGEDKAVATIKAGANDYVSKDRLVRLGPTVERTLRDADERRKRKQAEEGLRESEARYRTLIEQSPIAVLISRKGTPLYANQKLMTMFGLAGVEDLISRPVAEYYAPPFREESIERSKRRALGLPVPSELESLCQRPDGSQFPAQFTIAMIQLPDGPANISFISDITERKKSEADLRESLLGLHNALGGIILVLSAVSEKRDPYTAGHQRRVADLAEAIARDMGLSQDRIEGIRVAGIIHDIGKLSIPAELLSKPGSLSKVEYALIQYHAQVGHDILGDVKFAWPIATMILQHHERLDGSGYPQGLKGGDIILESRILAVADVIEAMASHRPYRASLGIEAALNEIERCRSGLYDPDVVASCLRLFREQGYSLKT